MTTLAEAYANAGKALLDLADALTTPQDAPSATPAAKPQLDTTWTETDDWEDTPQGRSKGGGCPIHDVPWAIRPAGTSKKTGAPYSAFWHCNEQDDDGTYCRQKPTAAWVKAHPIR